MESRLEYESLEGLIDILEQG